MNNGPTERMAVSTIKNIIGDSEYLDASDLRESDTGLTFDGSLKTLFGGGKKT